MTKRRPIPAVLFGLVCLASLLLPPASHAGPYHVATCHGDGINAVFAPNGAHYGAAYVECPGGVNGNRGLVVRNVDSANPAPAWSHARLTATAPPGTYFDGINFVGQVYANSGWVSGLFDAANARWVWCGLGCGTLPIWTGFDIGGFATQRLDIVTMCSAERCNRRGVQGAVMLKDVRLRVQDPTRPSITRISGPLASGRWLSGVQTIAVAGSDNAGVKTLRVRIGSGSGKEAHTHCDDHYLAPCPGSAQRDLNVETDRLSDGRHVLTVDVEDIGGNVATANLALLVDNTPPAAVQTLTAPSSAWQSRNSFAASWANPPTGRGAPIAGVSFQLCPEPGVAKPCQPIQRVARSAVKTLGSIRVPSPGIWNLRIWLSDAAGNENPQTFREVPLRWDPEPPSVKLLPRSGEDPTRIIVRASDQVSGIAVAEVEVSRAGESIWHSLPVVSHDQGFSAVVDDEALPPGMYKLRTRARDHAGNERSVEGTSLRLPIRLTTKLAVGKSERLQVDRAGDRRGRHVLIRKPRTRYGRVMRLTGRLVSPGGNPLADRDVEVTQQLRVPGQEWTPVATVRTNAAGRFAFRAPAGPSRLLRFRYAGSPTIRGESSVVDLRVRATSSLSVNRRRVVNGDAVTFRGTVPGEPLPAVGKLLQLQVYSRGQWLTFATPRADARGNWSHDYRFTATRGVTRYRFRVRLPREAGYPYEAGSSRAVTVKVVGL